MRKGGKVDKRVEQKRSENEWPELSAEMWQFWSPWPGDSESERSEFNGDVGFSYAGLRDGEQDAVLLGG